MQHPRAAPRSPIFAIFAGLAMMLSPKVGVLSPKVGLSTQALAQPAFCVLYRRCAPRERRLGAWKGACGTSVVGARESPFKNYLLKPLCLGLSEYAYHVSHLTGGWRPQVVEVRG